MMKKEQFYRNLDDHPINYSGMINLLKSNTLVHKNKQDVI